MSVNGNEKWDYALGMIKGQIKEALYKKYDIKE